MKRWFVALLVALSAAPALAAPAEEIGRIRSVEGGAWIVRDGATVVVAVSTVIQRGDVIHTGRPGAVGIVLKDETTVSLGPGGELQMVDYAFEPKEKKFALVMRMVRGTFSYLAGLMGKLAPGAIQLQLPEATIAVRGTKLLIQVEE